MTEHNSWILFGGEFMWIFWMLLVIVITMLACNFMNKNKNRFSQSNKHETPMDILKKRYAQGEIDDDEFKRKAKDLNS